MATISGLNRLEVDLGEASAQVVAQASAVVRAAGQAVVRDAQAMAPVDTGALRASISVDYDNGGLAFEAGPTVSYGGYVEQGTSRMAPHAYLGPAFDRNVPGVVTALGILGARVI
jgi:HK97 gp10 family phage protein